MESLLAESKYMKYDLSNLKYAAPEVIVEHGHYTPLGMHGEIINDCDSDKIPRNWRPLVSEAVRAYHDAASLSGLTLAAVYLSGSVPRGLALDGLSDLSMFAYFVPPPGTCAATSPVAIDRSLST